MDDFLCPTTPGAMRVRGGCAGPFGMSNREMNSLLRSLGRLTNLLERGTRGLGKSRMDALCRINQWHGENLVTVALGPSRSGGFPVSLSRRLAVILHLG